MEFKTNFVVYDLETGGLWPHNNPICEVAIIVLNSSFEEVLRYNRLIKPYGGFSGNLAYTEKAFKVNGYSEARLIEEGEDATTIYNELVSIFKSLKISYQKPILVGHNIAEFDNGMFEWFFNIFEKPKIYPSGAQSLSPSLYNYVSKYSIDTMFEARKKWGLASEEEQLENYQLPTCCKKIGIENYDAHNGAADTEATARLFEYLYRSGIGNNSNFALSDNGASKGNKYQFQF